MTHLNFFLKRDSARDFCSLDFYSHKLQLVQVRDLKKIQENRILHLRIYEFDISTNQIDISQKNSGKLVFISFNRFQEKIPLFSENSKMI